MSPNDLGDPLTFNVTTGQFSIKSPVLQAAIRAATINQRNRLRRQSKFVNANFVRK